MSRLLKIFGLALFLLAISVFAPRRAEANYLDLAGQDSGELYKQALESDSMNYSQFSLSSLDQISLGLTKKMIDYPPLEGETNNRSLLNSTGNAIAYLYANQPSFVHYLAYEGQKLNLIKPAYAAEGEGWKFLGDSTLKIWIISRNISYLFFVVIFVAIGFMIMFRSKLNPQTVINIQLALPKIVVSLILVTFSYAISALTVDVVFLGNNLIRAIVTTQGDKNSACDSGYNHIIFKNISVPYPVKWEQDCAKKQFTPSAWPFDILTSYAAQGKDISNFILNMFLLMGKAMAGSLGGNFADLFRLIISFAVISAVFKIFFSLLTKYVMIVILTIMMPFNFLAEALSAQASPFKPIKALLANTVSFPVTTFLLALCYFFASSGITFTNDLPPFYISGWADKPEELTSSLLAVGILLAIPTILAGIDRALEAQPIAQAATEQIAGGFRKIPIIGGMMS